MNTLHQSALIEKIATSVRDTQPLPAMSMESTREAYDIQKQVAKAVDPSGPHDLKAGITSRVMQQHLGLQSPLVGSLYATRKLGNDCKLTLKEGQELECEIGVVVDSSGNPIGLCPIVEVIYLSFSRNEDLSIPNIVAANLGADRYICGDILPWDSSAKNVSIDVYIDDKLEATLSNDYSFGAPIEGAAWMIAEATKLGLFKPGQQSSTILSLGTCGQALEGKSGTYRIEFDTLGELRFEIE